MEIGLIASLLVQDDVHQAIVASSLMKFDLQDRTTCPRCNLKGNATFPSSGRPKFGIIGIVGVSFVPCPSQSAWSLLSRGIRFREVTAARLLEWQLSVIGELAT